jgi:hypothetical protein
MKYKAFQDWYSEGNIKHLILHEFNGYLISPPFSTERCKDYNSIMKYDGNISYIETKLSPAVSKTNCVIEVNGSLYFIPYGIYENNYNTILEFKNDSLIYHVIPAKGKGQFYSGASNGNIGFSYPLGYEGTQYALHIVDNIPKLIEFKHSVPKAHMGTVFCNGKFYSMPRGDEPGYDKLISFDGKNFEFFEIPNIDPAITRKYTDLIIVNNILYSLPYGETKGLTDVIEFNTETRDFKLHKLNVPDFAKKYNCMVLNGNHIIGLPYGDEYCEDSNWGIVFNTITKESKCFDIGITHGGKYRYRCSICYYNLAVFFPTGTPQCPIIAVNNDGEIIYKKYYSNIMFGRPVIYQEKIHVIGYDIHTEKHYIYKFDYAWNTEIIEL